MTHPSFPNPPIVEAIAALRFAGGEDWSDELLDRLRSAIAAIYDGPRRQDFQVHVQAQLQQGDATTTTRHIPTRTLLTASDDAGLVGIARGVLSVHVLAPYPGWQAFRRRIEEVITITRTHLEIDRAHLSEVAVRYVDRIALPPGAAPDLVDYFTAIPRRPARMPTHLSTFQTIMETRDPETETVAVLTTSAVPPAGDESFVMLYDLHVVQPFSVEAPLPLDRAMTVLDDLHERQYEIFMDSITARTQELFQ